MTFNQIQKFCKKTAYCKVYVLEGVQWFTDGIAYFPIYDMPVMTDEQLACMLSVAAEDRDKWEISVEYGLLSEHCLDDINADDKELCAGKLRISEGKSEYMPLFGEGGIYYIKAKYFDELIKAKNTVYNFYLRVITDEYGIEYGVVAVKEGMLLKALINIDDFTVNGTREMCRISKYYDAGDAERAYCGKLRQQKRL